MTLTLGPILPLASWIQRSNRRLPFRYSILHLARKLAPHNASGELEKSKARKLIFTTFYDTSLLVATTLGAACIKSAVEEPGLYQLSYLKYISEISIGSLLATFIMIGKYFRKPTARFLASLPALLILIAIEGISKHFSAENIKYDVVPFYKTIGLDCTTASQILEYLKDATFPHTALHIFTLAYFLVFVLYFIITGTHMMRGKPLPGKQYPYFQATERVAHIYT